MFKNFFKRKRDIELENIFSLIENMPEDVIKNHEIVRFPPVDLTGLHDNFKNVTLYSYMDHFNEYCENHKLKD